MEMMYFYGVKFMPHVILNKNEESQKKNKVLRKKHIIRKKLMTVTKEAYIFFISCINDFCNIFSGDTY